MLQAYRTVSQHGIDEVIIKRSRFIGQAMPVASEEEAQAFVAAIRKEHPQANHHCYAYIIGERDQWQKASDDGEPSGTAGKPILEVIKQQGLKNTVVVVSRYFGGVLLGTGGLVRAYTDGAVVGLRAAQPVEQVLHRQVAVTIDYTWHGKVENELRNKGTWLGETVFTDKVTVNCMPEESEYEAFVEWMTDVTQGQAVIVVCEASYLAHPID